MDQPSGSQVKGPVAMSFSASRVWQGLICVLAGLFWIAHRVDFSLFYADYRDAVISPFDSVEISLLSGAFLATAALAVCYSSIRRSRRGGRRVLRLLSLERRLQGSVTSSKMGS
jgi:hypothetical protein